MKSSFNGIGDRAVLHTAVRHQNLAMAKLLIELKAEIHCKLFYDDLRVRQIYILFLELIGGLCTIS